MRRSTCNVRRRPPLGGAPATPFGRRRRRSSPRRGAGSPSSAPRLSQHADTVVGPSSSSTSTGRSLRPRRSARPRSIRGGPRYRRLLLRPPVELRPEESRGRLQDLVRPTELFVLTLELCDLVALASREPGTISGLHFGLQHPGRIVSLPRPNWRPTAVTPPSVTPLASRHSFTSRTARSLNSSEYTRGLPMDSILLAQNGASVDPGSVHPGGLGHAWVRSGIGIRGHLVDLGMLQCSRADDERESVLSGTDQPASRSSPPLGH